MARLNSRLHTSKLTSATTLMSAQAFNRNFLWIPALCLMLGLTGCATVQQPHRGHLQSAVAELRACAEFFRELDKTIDRAGVADIGARRVAGFPYLRVDRFLSSFRAQANDDGALRQSWSEQLLELDSLGRSIEIANLPTAEIERLTAAGEDGLSATLQDCSEQLAATDLTNQASIDLLGQRALVKDDYSSLKRALGLYALTRYPFHLGVENWQEQAANTIEAVRDGVAPAHPTLRYLPPDNPGYSRREVSAILQRAASHPLGMVELSATEKQRLFATFAPVFEIETAGDFDRLGQLYWAEDNKPQVDISRPVVYTRLEHTRMNEQTLLQLVYVAWMPARPRQHAFDLLGGQLDGLVWRVTLAPNGEPVLFDSIHPCGCYHMFFPTPRMQPIPSPSATLEWAFVPARLPSIAAGQRLNLNLQSRTHYLHNVWPDDPAPGLRYRFVDYHVLRSLPLSDGSSRSIFGPDGLVEGSERRERFLFWPMGIKSAGAMRQAGTQATAFVGRRHFDDADLIAKRFRLLD